MLKYLLVLGVCVAHALAVNKAQDHSLKLSSAFPTFHEIIAQLPDFKKSRETELRKSRSKGIIVE